MNVIVQVPTKSPRVAAVNGKKQVSIRYLLEWAFQRECASIDLGGDFGGGGGVGIEWVMMQRAQLGCNIDGGGRSDPHEDAQLVADALAVLPAGYGGPRMGLAVAEMARRGTVPDWMPDATPKVQPRHWRNTRHGATSATEVIGSYETVYRGRRIKHEIKVCPITISPTVDQIASARREYLRWYGALLELRTSFQLYGGLISHEVTDEMPVMCPWRDGSKKSVD